MHKSLFVPDLFNNRVQRFNETSNYLLEASADTFINSGLNWCQGLIILKNCSVLVSNYGSKSVTKFDALPLS